MTKSGAVLLVISLLLGCSTKRLPLAEPRAVPARPEALFPQPNESQSNQLARLDTLLRGAVRKLDLSWVPDMGAVAIPTCTREARDPTLSVDARDLILVVMGNALRKAGFYEQPDAKNDLVVPVLQTALSDPEPGLRRSAAFAARFVDDARLVPALRALLKDQASVQEQAVLALGMNGRAPEVAPIAALFFQTDNGTFRYSCLYSLATMCLRHGVDVAAVLGQNEASFGEKNRRNVESVSGRFVEFKAIAALVRKLSSGNVSERRDADEKLRKLTGRQVAFDPAGNDTARRRGIEEWEKYLLKDYWLAPPPPKP